MPSLATVPLDQLSLICVDLETTGLVTATDRIIQIGCISPFDASVSIDQLVNPTVPIPSSSTQIHGLTDADVATAPVFQVVFPGFRDLVKDKVIIGYNIGFDLAVIAAEADRHGLDWQPGPALCVRQLATLILGRDTMLMMGDLDSLSAHYGISGDGRHTALGDARMTAALFCALLPDLQARNITTLADARRAVSSLDDQRLATTKAGWVDVAAAPETTMNQTRLARIDPFPYSHRVSEIMHSPPHIISPDQTVLDAARLMSEQRLDCVFIGTGPDQIAGIASERDIVRCMALPTDAVVRARDIPLHNIMSAPVITVSADDYLHIALGRIHTHDIRHLGVTDATGRLAGWISVRDLTRQRLTEAMIIGDELSGAGSAADMRAALAGLPSLSASLQAEGIASYDIAAVISGQYRAAMRKAAELAESELGPAPLSWSLLILGSGGRNESLLAPDQDHALIFDDMPDTATDAERKAALDWFLTFGQAIAERLDAAGIPYCTGGVMSSSARWCKPLSGWKQTISEWVTHGRAEDMLSVDIFFDYQPVCGEFGLADQLQDHIRTSVDGQHDFLKSLARNVQNHSAGTTIFGGLKTENGRFNLKLHLLLPITETLRVLAISRSIDTRNGARRAADIFTTGTVPPEILQLSEDLQFCIRLILRQQITDLAAGRPATTSIDPALLAPQEKRLLKSIQARAGRLHQLLFNCLF